MTVIHGGKSDLQYELEQLAKKEEAEYMKGLENETKARRTSWSAWTKAVVRTTLNPFGSAERMAYGPDYWLKSADETTASEWAMEIGMFVITSYGISKSTKAGQKAGMEYKPPKKYVNSKGKAFNKSERESIDNFNRLLNKLTPSAQRELNIKATGMNHNRLLAGWEKMKRLYGVSSEQAERAKDLADEAWMQHSRSRAEAADAKYAANRAAEYTQPSSVKGRIEAQRKQRLEEARIREKQFVEDGGKLPTMAEMIAERKELLKDTPLKKYKRPTPEEFKQWKSWKIYEKVEQARQAARAEASRQRAREKQAREAEISRLADEAATAELETLGGKAPTMADLKDQSRLGGRFPQDREPTSAEFARWSRAETARRIAEIKRNNADTVDVDLWTPSKYDDLLSGDSILSPSQRAEFIKTFEMHRTKTKPKPIEIKPEATEGATEPSAFADPDFIRAWYARDKTARARMRSDYAGLRRMGIPHGRVMALLGAMALTAGAVTVATTGAGTSDDDEPEEPDPEEPEPEEPEPEEPEPEEPEPEEPEPEGMDLVEDVDEPPPPNKTIDYGGDPNDIDVLKQLQEEFKNADKVDYEKEKEHAMSKLGYTEHQYETFKKFRKDNKAEGVHFTDYVKYHHEYERVKDEMKRLNIDFNQFYTQKTTPKEPHDTAPADTPHSKAPQQLHKMGVKLDPITEAENEQAEDTDPTDPDENEDTKPTDPTDPDENEMEKDVGKLVKEYAQQLKNVDQLKDVQYENLATEIKTDKQELIYLCQLAEMAYSEENVLPNHKIYFSEKTGTPLARIVEDEEFIILAIRGTDNMRDLFDDFDFKETRLTEAFEEVSEEHDAITSRGFIDFAKSLYDSVYVDLLKKLFETGKSLVITSHSLGCAGALILHKIFMSTGQPVDMNVMFGSPRIFYYTPENFDDFKNENILRVCIENDIITFAPPMDLFPAFHVGNSLFISKDDFKINPYGDYERDADFMNQLFEYGKSKISGQVMGYIFKSLIPEIMLVSMFTPAKIQKYYKLFNDAYENHRTSAYINLLDVLPDEINFKVDEEEAQAKHTTKIKNEKKTELKKVFQSKVEQLKKKHQPHTDEIKRFAVSPEVLGFYFYKNEEDIKDKLFVFS